jgi:DNA primase large subunit
MPLRARVESLAEQQLDQRKDLASHFILRLAYCRTEDLRRWFLAQECHLFKFRLDRLEPQQRKDFMASNGMEFELVTMDERLELRDKLVGLAGVVDTTVVTTDLYKVPYLQALPLLSKREVFLKGGFAYVPLNRLVTTIVTRFRTTLSRALAEAVTQFDMVTSADPRIGPLLKNMNNQYMGRDFTKGVVTDKITPESIDSRADNNMPLCMKQLHGGLKRDHKLKHWGRLQYGLFLKGAGLSLEDAVRFWESHFSKVMAHDAFQKNYSYSFRHMYGKEGARKDYTPYSCLKIIIGTPPEAGAYHGCPYRHMPENQLVSLLGSLSIGGKDLQDIMGKVKNGHYQIACQLHFDITHPDHLNMQLQSDDVGIHPNSWHLASVAYHKLKNGNKSETAGVGETKSEDGSKSMDVSTNVASFDAGTDATTDA